MLLKKILFSTLYERYTRFKFTKTLDPVSFLGYGEKIRDNIPVLWNDKGITHRLSQFFTRKQAEAVRKRCIIRPRITMMVH